jgi:hypothetical protein
MPNQFDPPAQSPTGARRLPRLSKNGKPLGRPPASGNKRSPDLARYIAATFAGATPGQQAAQLALVTPGELKRARADAVELGLIDLSLPPLILAMAVKAAKLALVLKCDRRDAWLMLQKERADLMPYVHQRQAQMAEKKDPGALPLVFMMEAGGQDPGQLAALDDDEGDTLEMVEDLPDA